MVLSLFSGAALADPIIGGRDAGNTAGQASSLESSIPLNSWSIYANGQFTIPSDEDDYYRLNTQNGEYLNYQLDLANYLSVQQKITDTGGNPLNAPVNAGKTLRLYGSTLSWDHKIQLDIKNPYYMFAMKRTLT